MSETATVWTTSLRLQQYESQTGNLEIKGGPPVIVHKNKTGNVPTYKRNIEARSCEHCYREKAVSTGYSGGLGWRSG
jgi:hypothetical protein